MVLFLRLAIFKNEYTFRVEMAMSPVNDIIVVMWLNKIEDLWLYYHDGIVIFGIFIR